MQEMLIQSLVWEDPLKKEKKPTPVFLPGELHEQRSHSPWDCKEYKASTSRQFRNARAETWTLIWSQPATWDFTFPRASGLHPSPCGHLQLMLWSQHCTPHMLQVIHQGTCLSRVSPESRPLPPQVSHPLATPQHLGKEQNTMLVYWLWNVTSWGQVYPNVHRAPPQRRYGQNQDPFGWDLDFKKDGSLHEEPLSHEVPLWAGFTSQLQGILLRAQNFHLLLLLPAHIPH